MSAERNTHLLDWLSDGWTHCQHGSKEWCEAYLHNARDTILSQDEALASSQEEIARLTRERDDALRVEAAADSTYTHWRDRATSAEAEIARLREALEAIGCEAAAWVGYDETEPLTEGWGGGPATQLNVGHLRIAARALASKAGAA